MLRDKPTQTSQSAIGKVATNITGDSNSYDSHDINIYQPVSSGPHRPLTKTLMYKLLQIMIRRLSQRAKISPLRLRLL